MEDANEMRVVKADMEEQRRAFPNIGEMVRTHAFRPRLDRRPELKEARAKHRIGIPRILNIWTTHQFWLGFFEALGIPSNRVVFSSDTSEEQGREFGRGRGTVDCCYPVKCMSGHYGELIFGQKRKIDILFSPMIRSLPSFLIGHVVDSLSCPRVMAGRRTSRPGSSRKRTSSPTTASATSARWCRSTA
jgi:predicted nucleotide-binding protein (sugar kinase/HSP70/actin superfamily)